MKNFELFKSAILATTITTLLFSTSSCKSSTCCSCGVSSTQPERSDRYKVLAEVDSLRLGISYYYMLRKDGLPKGNIEQVIKSILSEDDLPSQYLRKNCSFVIENPSIALKYIEYKIIDEDNGRFYLGMREDDKD